MPVKYGAIYLMRLACNATDSCATCFYAKPNAAGLRCGLHKSQLPARVRIYLTRVRCARYVPPQSDPDAVALYNQLVQQGTRNHDGTTPQPIAEPPPRRPDYEPAPEPPAPDPWAEFLNWDGRS